MQHDCGFAFLQALLLDEVSVNQYKLFGDAMWAPADGTNRLAWAKAGESMLDVVLAASRRRNRQPGCKSGCFLRIAETFLLAIVDRLVPDRNIVAFANGVYVLDNAAFTSYR